MGCRATRLARAADRHGLLVWRGAADHIRVATTHHDRVLFQEAEPSLRGFPAVAALLELLLAQVVEVRVDVLVQDLIADAGVGGEGDCGEVDVDARRRRAVLIVLILFEKFGDGGGVERRLVGEVLGAGRAADGEVDGLFAPRYERVRLLNK